MILPQNQLITKMKMNNLVAAIEYDGTKFQGSQKQPNTRTVQGTFDEALTSIHKKNVISAFASRTDSGVHATKQVVNFKSNLDITEESWVDTLNYNLPKDIRVFKCNSIENNIDVRRDALEREYTYRLIIGDRISPIEYNYFEHIKESLDTSKLEKAINIFIGKHNFLSFTGRLLPKDSNTIREIKSIKYNFSDRKMDIIIIGNSFLYQQVRRIVGSLILLMKNKISINNIQEALNMPIKGKFNLLVSSKGLYLSDIKYKNILY